jgi:hypothetical protein
LLGGTDKERYFIAGRLDFNFDIGVLSGSVEPSDGVAGDREVKRLAGLEGQDAGSARERAAYGGIGAIALPPTLIAQSRDIQMVSPKPAAQPTRPPISVLQSPIFVYRPARLKWRYRKTAVDSVFLLTSRAELC